MRETLVRPGHHSAEGFRGKTVQGMALTCQEDEQAQGDSFHDAAVAWRGVGEGPALAGPLRCYQGLWFPIPSYSTPH